MELLALALHHLVLLVLPALVLHGPVVWVLVLHRALLVYLLVVLLPVDLGLLLLAGEVPGLGLLLNSHYPLLAHPWPGRPYHEPHRVPQT